MSASGEPLAAGAAIPLRMAGRGDLAAAALVAAALHGMLFITLPAILAPEAAGVGQRAGSVSVEISLQGNAAAEESDFVPLPPAPETEYPPEPVSEPVLPEERAGDEPLPDPPRIPANLSRPAQPGSPEAGSRAATVADWHLVYPEKADRERRTGVATVRVEILASGRAGKVELVGSSGHADLDAAAVESLRRARYRPATEGGKAVSSVKLLNVRFRLPEGEKAKR